jgi:hypothetical protein
VLPQWKSVWKFFKKLKIELPCDPAVSLQGIYLKRCKSMYSRETCTPRFIAARYAISLSVHQLMNG